MEQLLYQYAWLIPVFPLFASFTLGLGLISFRKATQSLRRDLGFFTIALLGLSVILSVSIFFFQYFGTSTYQWEMEWVVSQNFSLEIGYLLDPLSSIMLVVVSTVGFLVM